MNAGRTAADSGTHGENVASLTAIAKLWLAYLSTRVNGSSAPLQPSEVPALTILTKLLVAEWGYFLDGHVVDAAGYAEILGELKKLEDEAGVPF